MILSFVPVLSSRAADHEVENVFGVLASFEYNDKVAKDSGHAGVAAPGADEYLDLCKEPVETGVTPTNDENALLQSLRFISRIIDAKGDDNDAVG